MRRSPWFEVRPAVPEEVRTGRLAPRDRPPVAPVPYRVLRQCSSWRTTVGEAVALNSGSRVVEGRTADGMHAIGRYAAVIGRRHKQLPGGSMPLPLLRARAHPPEYRVNTRGHGLDLVRASSVQHDRGQTHDSEHAAGSPGEPADTHLAGRGPGDDVRRIQLTDDRDAAVHQAMYDWYMSGATPPHEPGAQS
jgi:hypothetical protein